MKLLAAMMLGAVLLGVTGCAVEAPAGGYYGTYDGEYPRAYYGRGYYHEHDRYWHHDHDRDDYRHYWHGD